MVFLPNRSSAGLTLVVVWGVDLYAIKYLRTSFFHCFPLACTICNLFKSCLCLPTSPFAWGHNGMVFVCSIPQPSKIFQMAHCHWLLIVVNHESWRFSRDSKWSPQMLWNTWSQFHNNYLLKQSTTTNTESPDSKGPNKNPGPSLAMDLVLRGLTWLAQDGQDCLLAGIPNTICKILLSRCQSRATILLIKTSASY